MHTRLFQIAEWLGPGFWGWRLVHLIFHKGGRLILSRGALWVAEMLLMPDNHLDDAHRLAGHDKNYLSTVARFHHAILLTPCGPGRASTPAQSSVNLGNNADQQPYC